MTTPDLIKRRPWTWVPSLYYIEGLPYLMVVVITSTMYIRLGIPNSEMALYTGSLYLPWVIKPFWSPFVDLLRSKREWVIATQLAMGLGLAGVAFFMPGDNFFFFTLACFWVVAFCSATHDIAADGYYLLALREDQQSFFVGIRTTFYRFAMLTEGILLGIAGWLEHKMDRPVAWAWTMAGVAGIMALGALYHGFALPKVEKTEQVDKQTVASVFQGYGEILISFFNRKHILPILGFLLLYRLGEAQLAKMVSPFFLDDPANGGLALATEEVGFVKGIIGIVTLIVGGVLGGILVAKDGLKHWLWWMMIAINLPNILYVVLAITQPTNIWWIAASVGVEQFGYGFGFTAYVMYLIYLADGPHKTAHYAIGTGFMALGMMLPGMVSGYIQEWLGYTNFFIWVVVATIPAFLFAKYIPLHASFGKNKTEEKDDPIDKKIDEIGDSQ